MDRWTDGPLVLRQLEPLQHSENSFLKRNSPEETGEETETRSGAGHRGRVLLSHRGQSCSLSFD